MLIHKAAGSDVQQQQKQQGSNQTKQLAWTLSVVGQLR
jgi:hypothetical protein